VEKMLERPGIMEMIPDRKDIGPYMELSGKYHLGFEYNDFYNPDLLDDEKALKERIAFYQGLHRPAAMEGEGRFGICLDIGHVMLVTEEPEQWFSLLAPHIRHFHLNDNHFKRDEHLALGSGSISWSHIFQLMEQYGLGDRSILLEVNDLDKVRASLDYLSGVCSQELREV